MVSYSMDYYWSQSEARRAVPVNERQRIESPLESSGYDYFSYLTYIFYAPLYLAGPIITFNNFTHQMKSPPASITSRSIFLYTLRWIGVVALMELMIHLFFVVAIKDTKALNGLTPMQIFCVGYFNLKFIWLKVEKIDLASDNLEIFQNVGND